MSRVLVLDDDADIASVVSMILEMNGFECEYITNHRNLEQKLTTYNPDLLILDIALGDADGREICQRLKLGGNLPNLPIVLFSANRDASKDFKNYLAEAFIPKPFEATQLVSTIKNLVHGN